MSDRYFIGCDVGTGSARAGVFDENGKMYPMAECPTKMWRPETDFVEQSSEDIWQASCKSINKAIGEAGIKQEQVRGIGFDATCSLVVLNEHDEPVTVSPDDEAEQNIIVWMDHRAIGEAEEINEKGHEVLKYVGNTISPEMETPKLLWLKRNKPETWEKAAKFFDLADYLVYCATGTDVRSVCTTTCKWTYLGHEKVESEESVGRWDDSYFEEIGLEDLVQENYWRIGKKVRPVGEPVGEGLQKKAAQQMGLKAGTAVGVGIIDAHAGGLGLLGMSPDSAEKEQAGLYNRLQK